jgi:hypothetical protein
VRLFARVNGDVVVSELLEKRMAHQTVDARNKYFLFPIVFFYVEVDVSNLASLLH